MAHVYLGLGSNQGDRAANLAAARDGLAALPETRLLRTASVYLTRPVGGPLGQEDFYNSACLVDTALPPRRLLGEIHRLERVIGRRRENERVRWGPRAIDIDILLWDGLTLAEPDLVIPHPRLATRAFALAPLAELDPEFRHPAEGASVGELLERIDQEHEGIRRLSF